MIDSTTIFDAFVERCQSEQRLRQAPVLVAPTITSTDWPARRDYWIQHLNSLYAQIEKALSKYIVFSKVQLRYVPKHLSEENIGVYPVRALAICIGIQVIELIPVGTLLLLAKGRVNVEGPHGEARFTLFDATENKPNAPTVWQWKIVRETGARSIPIPVTDESILQLLMDVTEKRDTASAPAAAAQQAQAIAKAALEGQKWQH